MSADNILAAGPRRKAWMRLTEHQRSEAARLVVAVIAGAAAGSSSAVASALMEAGRMSPRLEEHVAWAAAQQTGQLVLSVDPERQISRYLTQGMQLRSQQQATQEQQEGLFS